MPDYWSNVSVTQGEHPMQTIFKGYRGLSILMDLNWDRLLYMCTMIFALCAGAYFGSLH